MPLDLANGSSWWCCFLDSGCSQVIFAYYSYVNNLQEGWFFVLLYCVVKYANIFDSCCKESSRSEFGNSRQRLFFHIGINITLQTRRINTREGFFCNIWYQSKTVSGPKYYVVPIFLDILFLCTFSLNST